MTRAPKSVRQKSYLPPSAKNVFCRCGDFRHVRAPCPGTGAATRLTLCGTACAPPAQPRDATRNAPRLSGGRAAQPRQPRRTATSAGSPSRTGLRLDCGWTAAGTLGRWTALHWTALHCTGLHGTAAGTRSSWDAGPAGAARRFMGEEEGGRPEGSGAGSLSGSGEGGGRRGGRRGGGGSRGRASSRTGGVTRTAGEGAEAAAGEEAEGVEKGVTRPGSATPVGATAASRTRRSPAAARGTVLGAEPIKRVWLQQEAEEAEANRREIEAEE